MRSCSPSSAFPSPLPPSHQCLNMYWYRPLLLNQLLLILHPSPIPVPLLHKRTSRSVAYSHCPTFLMSHSSPCPNLLAPASSLPCKLRERPAGLSQMWTSHNSYLFTPRNKEQKKKKKKIKHFTQSVRKIAIIQVLPGRTDQVAKAGGPFGLRSPLNWL